MNRWLRNSLVIFILLFAVSSCTRVTLNRNRVTTLADSGIRINLHYADQNDWDARLIQDQLDYAISRATSWGKLRESVTIAIYPTQRDLAQAVGRRGYDWLRAWATYDTISIQAPSTWAFPNTGEATRQLITHELTHVVLYQTIGDRSNWHSRAIPLWFREGMASTAANQETSRLSRSQLREYYLGQDFRGDPIAEGRRLLQDAPLPVYSAGHWLFTDLLATRGQKSIKQLLNQVAQGDSFREAWLKIYDESLLVFEENWRDNLLDGAMSAGGTLRKN